MNLRRLRSEDDGAILILAILVVTTIALVVSAVLTRGDGSLRATIALREVAGTTYAADAAAQVAINDLRTGGVDASSVAMGSTWAYNNRQPGPGCFGEDAAGDPIHELRLPGFYPASAASGDGPTSAVVTCTPEDATGASGAPVPVTNANKPGHAILTLGTSASEVGVDVKPQSSTVEQFRVHGGIWSNSTIVSSIGQLRSSQSIRAHSGCTPVSGMEAPLVDCAAVTVPDPDYAHELAATGVPALQTVPTSCGAVVTFEPGYYDDAAALNDITNKPACAGSTFWFKPGTYYFDFHNNPADVMYDSDTNRGGSGGSEWVVGVGRLVAGTPDGSITAVTDASYPGSCVNPIDNVSNDGVQFVFGGDSRLKVDDGANVEICGSYHTDRPPIALFGLKSGVPTATRLTEAAGDDGDPLTSSGTPTVTPAGTDNTFVGATEAALRDAGNGAATWFRPTTGTAATVSRTVSMTGFAPPVTVPKGSVLKDATLIVRHKSAQANAGTASTIALTPAGGTALATFNLDRPGTMTTQSIDLRVQQAAVFNALQKQVHERGYTGAKIDFTATIAKGLPVTATAELDAVRLELQFYAPQLRGQTNSGLGPSATNCLATLNSCAVISTPTNYKDSFYIQGTTYTPISRIDLNLNQATAQVMRFGVIARSLAARTTGGYAYDGAVIELPDNSPGWGFSGTLVQLKVYLCPNSATCTTGTGTLALTSRVQLWDPTGAPEPGQREITVLSWSHRR